MFNVLLCADTGACERWLERLRVVADRCDGPMHLLALFLDGLGEHNTMTPTRYAAEYRSWPPESRPLGERCLMDRMLVCLLYTSRCV